jgi:hypothetical protein
MKIGIDVVIGSVGVVGMLIGDIYFAQSHPEMASTITDALSVLFISGLVFFIIKKKTISNLVVCAIIAFMGLSVYFHIHYHLNLFANKQLWKILLFILFVIVVSGIGIIMTGKSSKR